MRYEDSYTARMMGDGKFAVGVLLKEVCTYTTKEDWKRTGLQIGAEIMHKVCKLENFTVFIDYKDKYNMRPNDAKADNLFNIETLQGDKNGKIL